MAREAWMLGGSKLRTSASISKIRTNANYHISNRVGLAGKSIIITNSIKYE